MVSCEDRWASDVDASDTAGAIVVAAGESLRMAGVDKIFAPLMGRPLIAHSLSVINDSLHVSSIVLVLSSGTLDQGRRLAESNGWGKVKHVCVGGERRQDSVRLGLELLPESDWVIVHDGARPILDAAMIGTALEAAHPTGAAVAAVPVKDTIKLADADGVVTETLHRDRLWAAQTPQVFRRQLLAEAHRRITEDVTDGRLHGGVDGSRSADFHGLP